MSWLRHFALPLAILGASAGAARAADPAAAVATPTAELESKIAEAHRLHLTNSTRSRQLAEEALAMARTQHDRKNEAVALLELTVALRRQSHNGAALQNVRDALAIVETLDDRRLLRRTLQEVGRTYWVLSDAPDATHFFQRALSLSEEDGDLSAQADAHAGLGSVAAHLGDIARSRAEKEIALQLAERSGDINRIGNYAASLGNAHLAQKNFAQARQLFERALAIAQQLQQRTEAADIRALIARVDTAEGKLDAAEKTLRAILPSRRRLRGHVKLTDTLTQLAEVLRLQGKLDEAIGLLNEAAGYAAQLTSRSLRMNVYHELAATQEARGDFKSALTSLRQRQQEAEAQAGKAAQTRAAEIRETFAAERRDLEIVRLRSADHARLTALHAKEAEFRAQQAEIERARWQRYGLLSALAFGLITVAALISRHRVKARAARRILEEARAAQHTAETADRVKTRFLGIASHDIRAPLGNILTLTNELRAEPTTDELHAERCDMIGAEAQRVICLVEDLLTTAALESGKLELRMAPMDLGETTRDVIEGVRRQAEAKRQVIEFPAPAPGTGHMLGDPARLHQVVANVLSNAIKFSPPGETITVELERRDETVTLAVRDRGPGIAEQDIPKLFAPFQRLATHPTAGESSHGLGLSIAQDIIQRHGGQIRVQSQPGRGTTLRIELPAGGVATSTTAASIAAEI